MQFQKMAFSVFETSEPEIRSRLITSYQLGWQQSIQLSLQLNEKNKGKSDKAINK